MSVYQSSDELIVLENTERGHSKFWECERLADYGSSYWSEFPHVIRWGKIGNTPQGKTSSFSRMDRENRVNAKLADGYHVVYSGPKADYRKPKRAPAKPGKAPEGKVIISVLKRAAHANAS